MEPLNPTLFNLLREHLGQVTVTSPGQAINWVVSMSALADTQVDPTRIKPMRMVLASGEEYQVNCPFCNDTRQRLYINHMWGVWDEDTASYNLQLMQCYNEQCFSVPGQKWAFFTSLFAPQLRIKKRGALPIRQGTPTEAEPTKICPVSPPGVQFMLADLAKTNPMHEAVLYLASRGFPAEVVGPRYRLGFCTESRLKLARNRIIIPMYENDQLVGWQARYVGEVPKTKLEGGFKIPKYYTCPGMARKLLAYNFERAMRHETIVIVEGPMDAWAVGDCAMALWGKSMNKSLLARFGAAWRLRGSKQTIVVLLDSAWPKEKFRRPGKLHHIDQLVKDLIEYGIPPEMILPVWLDEDEDAGSYGLEGQKRLWLRIAMAGNKAGIKVSRKSLPECTT